MTPHTQTKTMPHGSYGLSARAHNLTRDASELVHHDEQQVQGRPFMQLCILCIESDPAALVAHYLDPPAEETALPLVCEN